MGFSFMARIAGFSVDLGIEPLRTILAVTLPINPPAGTVTEDRGTYQMNRNGAGVAIPALPTCATTTAHDQGDEGDKPNEKKDG